ncbi:arylsulfatase B-like [Cimex lectularius]|uniref:Sulfatase N-terminal domain-containing protein n=1 Tax=Cimex lectularius TaxID=79782 RepID=A0A8I6S1X4_CIMLE|nr:arylsulfatase B-like [Cimex lectularius]
MDTTMNNVSCLLVCCLFATFYDTGMALQSFRPHIVVIMADDLGWNDVGFHGSDQIPTPNLDALAYNGIILNNHYVQPVCTPSRSAFLCGRYPIHIGMQGGPLMVAQPDGLPLHLKLLPDYLRDLGYKTHLVGKWHLGFYRKDYLPTRRGFDSFFGFYGGYIGYYDYMSTFEVDGNQYYGLDLRKNDTPVWDYVGRYSTEVFSSEAVRVVKSHPVSEPLFLFMAHSAPHGSHKGRFLEAPQARVNSLKYILDPNRRTYAAMVSKMDDAVGELVEALKDKNMLDNTIILFLADNGAPSSSKAIFPNWGSNLPFRGAKETLWEGGVKSSSFIWSQQLQQNPRVSNQLIHVTDWVPTLYTAAGGDKLHLPSNLDGIDQWYSLVWNLPSRRTQALLNINEKDRNAAIVTTFDTVDVSKRTWKLVVGTFADGIFDGFLNDVRSPLTPPYEYKKIFNSKSFKALSTLYTPTSGEGQMRILRDEATVRCAEHPTDDLYAPDCSFHPCLFNLDRDPCEKVDLAPNNTAIVERLYNTLKLYRRSLVPQANHPLDIAGWDSSKFNNTVSPWVF